VNCLVCKELTRVLDTADTAYKSALAAPFYLVSTEIAARMQVDMERARIALSEHVSSCRSSDQGLVSLNTFLSGSGLSRLDSPSHS
jgi:hypothetical protein